MSTPRNHKLLWVLAATALIVAVQFATGLAAAAPPNQGDADKVLTVDNPNVACADPVPGAKVQGGLGRTISFSAADPIDFVTVKSGEGATVVAASFDTTTGTITLSKDVSNFVVWTCPPQATTTSSSTTSSTVPPSSSSSSSSVPPSSEPTSST